MASTNKTTHYELSQYVGSDKPTYLTDYNNDMSAIDTGIYNAQQKGDSAYTLAGTADGKADTAITNAGSAQTDASTALTRIGTLSDLTTTDKTSLVNAVNELKGDITDLETDLTEELLWTNLSPTNDFAGQEITLLKSATGYNEIRIYLDEYVPYNNYTVYDTWYSENRTNTISQALYDSGAIVRYRTFKFNATNKITFGDGYQQGVQSNSKIVPLKITGLK